MRCLCEGGGGVWCQCEGGDGVWYLCEGGDGEYGACVREGMVCVVSV